jgi:probable F420-dependent oxidoreductase
MRFGVCIFLTHYAASPASTARAAEQLGFDSLWMPEHPCIPVHYDTPFPGTQDGKAPRPYWTSYDPFVALSFAAAATATLKIATGICLVAQRDPIITAKEVASLDYLSGGRFLFGIGAGWLKEEMVLMGANYERRWSQVKDRVLAMKKIWTEEQAEYSGEFARFPKILAEPKPVQKPHPPVLLGGSHPNSYRRVGEWGDGWIPIGVPPEDIAKAKALIAEHARAAGRDPAKIEVSVFGPEPSRELLDSYAAVGVGRYVTFVASHGPGQMEKELARLAAQLPIEK